MGSAYLLISSHFFCGPVGLMNASLVGYRCRVMWGPIRVAAFKVGMLYVCPNPWFLREQLGVGVSLPIVRHGLEWALWGVCVSAIPMCFHVSVFSVVQLVGVSQI